MLPKVITSGQQSEHPVPAPRTVSRAVAKAASKTGAPIISLKNFGKFQDLGKMLTDAGATELSRGMFMMNMDVTQLVMKRLADMHRRKGDRVENLKIMQVLVQLLTHHAGLAEKISNSAPKKVEAPGSGGPVASLPPPGTIVNVGVKVGGNGGSNESSILRQVRIDGSVEHPGQEASV